MYGKQDYDYGPLDYLQLLTWYAMLALFVWQWGWIFGIVANVIFINVMGLILRSTMNLEFMAGNDEFFFMDDYRNRLNIVAF
mmetsp:Transcript_33700/g.41554  ORF Transcript_33700/g.41554 Transcript_33700/m.41554 type:complete len:82 (-) Transcript_33700:1304-1549(-)